MPIHRTVTAARTAAALFAAVMLMVDLPGVSALALTPVALKGQTSEQMAADQQECASQATAQTGYNPSAPPPTTSAAAPERGQRIAGAARGAAAGKVVSNVTKESETSEAKEAGAKLGVMKGGAQQRQGRREQRQQAEQQQAQAQQQASAYDNALSACLQSSGYSFQ
jgi:hypothetical protein